MQITTILRMLGVLLMLFSLSMIPPILVNAWYQDGYYSTYIISFVITGVTGFILWLPFKKHHKELKTRDGFVIVVLFWIVLSLFGALPFMLAKHSSLGFTDAFFETASGLTTTGASVLSGLDLFPHALIYYRQQLQFLGGMGIVVLAIAILPMLGVGGMQLYRAEMPGPMKDTKLTPRITETAKALWYLYVGLNVVCALAYWASGMTLFDAIGEAFATISTGGFTMHDASFAYYHNPFIELIAVVFMILGGVNFSLHFLAISKKSLKVYWADSEFCCFISLILSIFVITAITLYYYKAFYHPNTIIIKALFDVTSMLTTTGFVAGTFSDWPTFVPYLILIFALIGGCGGSTSGGMKVIRTMIIVKQGLLEIKRLIHPRSILTLKLGQKTLPDNLIQAVWGFFAMYLAVLALSLLLFLAAGNDIATAFGAVVAGVANAGAGIGGVADSFEPLNNFSKWVLIVDMFAGRLEIFTLLVLFTPAFWRK